MKQGQTNPSQGQPAPAQGQAPSPVLFFDTVNAYQRSAAIKAAVELGLFTAIAEGADAPAALAARVGAAERGVRILADYLTVLGFLTKRSGRYALTPDSALFLDRRSPAYVGGSVEFLLAPGLVAGFEDLTAAVRKGGIAASESGTLEPQHEVWVRFARGMRPMMEGAAQRLAELVLAGSKRPMKILDVSASHGAFGLAFARQNPAAKVVGLDWPNVLEVAKENAAAAGVGDRYSTIAGSAFDVDLGRGYDVILLPNFLHHFDPPTCEKLLRRVHAALAEGGRVATLEFIPDEDRVTPPMAATFAMTMLGTTPAGDAYTFAEYDRMFRNAGFARSELHELPGTVQRAVISYK
jgi:2-polyprenyl-3-methyl-5-hydroxy-6-metoxy-1,4-benzoquinol methylase